MVFKISRFESDLYLLSGDDARRLWGGILYSPGLLVRSFFNVYSVAGKVRLGGLGSPILFKVDR